MAYITCPQCRKKIRVEAPGHSPEPARPECRRKASEAVTAEGFERFEPGTRTALLYCPDKDAGQQLESVLKNMDYKIRAAKSAEDLIIRFKYHIYDLVFLYQKGPDIDDRLKEILDAINQLEMDIRRRILVIYIHLAGNRFDTLQAFFLSADLAITPLDIPKLPEIISDAMKSKSAIYSAFYDTRTSLQDDAL